MAAPKKAGGSGASFALAVKQQMIKRKGKGSKPVSGAAMSAVNSDSGKT